MVLCLKYLHHYKRSSMRLHRVRFRVHYYLYVTKLWNNKYIYQLRKQQIDYACRWHYLKYFKNSTGTIRPRFVYTITIYQKNNLFLNIKKTNFISFSTKQTHNKIFSLIASWTMALQSTQLGQCMLFSLTVLFLLGLLHWDQPPAFRQPPVRLQQMRFRTDSFLYFYKRMHLCEL